MAKGEGERKNCAACTQHCFRAGLPLSLSLSRSPSPDHRRCGARDVCGSRHFRSARRSLLRRPCQRESDDDSLLFDPPSFIHDDGYDTSHVSLGERLTEALGPYRAMSSAMSLEEGSRCARSLRRRRSNTCAGIRNRSGTVSEIEGAEEGGGLREMR